MNRALQYFLRLLAKKDYSKLDLETRASQKNHSPEDIKEAIFYLQNKNWLNEERAVTNFVQNYQATKGKIWLKQKLQLKKYPNQLIESALNLESKPDIERIKTKLGSKYKIENWQEIDQKTIQKILGYLARQGFSNSYEIFRQIKSDQD